MQHIYTEASRVIPNAFYSENHKKNDQIAKDTFKEIFKSIDVLGIDFVHSLCQMKLHCDVTHSEIANMISQQGFEDSTQANWLNDLSKENLEEIQKMLQTLKNDAPEIMDLLKSSGEMQEVPVLSQGEDHTWKVVIKKDAIYLKETHGDPEETKLMSVAQLMKSKPYLQKAKVANDSEVVSLNGKVNFLTTENTSSPELIWCKDFSPAYAKEVLEDASGVGKAEMAKFSTEKDIAKNIPIDIQTTYNNMRAHAQNYEFINNDKFGEHMKAYFENMQNSDGNEKLKVMLIESSNHSMSVRLRIKDTEDKAVYVISFYDPNKTDRLVRCETNNLASLESHTLRQYINILAKDGYDEYQTYYPESDDPTVEPISIMIEVNTNSLAGVSVTEKKELIKLPETITPMHMQHMAEANLFDKFESLDESIKQVAERSQDELIELLAGKRHDGMPALHAAIMNGHVDVVMHYAKWLTYVKDETKRAELIAAKLQDGTPALAKALTNKNVQIVNAFGELLKLIASKDTRKELVLAKNKDNMPGFQAAGLNMMDLMDSSGIVSTYIQLNKI